MSSVNNCDTCVIDKLTNLIDCYQMQETKESIKLIEGNIELYKFLIEDLIKRKPFWFQRKKLENYYIELRRLEEKLKQYYDELFREMQLIDELNLSLEFLK